MLSIQFSGEIKKQNHMKRFFVLLLLLCTITEVSKAQFWKPPTPPYQGKTTFCFDETMVLDTIPHPDSLTYEDDYRNLFYYIYDTAGCPASAPSLRLNNSGSDAHKLTFDGKVPHNHPFDLYIKAVRLWQPDKINHQFLYADSCQKISIHVDSLPIPFLPSDTTIAFGDSLNLQTKSYPRITWSTGSASQNIWAKDPGQYWVEVESANGCLGSDTFKLNVQQPNSVFSNSAQQHKITVFPNPNNGSFTLKANAWGSLEIIDLTGKTVYKKNIEAGLTEISLPPINEGIYFLKESATGTTTKLLIN